MGLFLLGLIFTSCKDCEPAPSSIYNIQVEMYNYDSLQLLKERVAYTDTFQRLGAEGLSLPIAEQTASGRWTLPLSNQAEQVTFVWEDRLGVRSLSLNYQKTPIPIPPDCGIYEVYEGLELGEHDFDSVRMVKTKVELEDQLHLEIFARRP